MSRVGVVVENEAPALRSASDAGKTPVVRRHRAGLTIVELLTVLVIMGILSTIAVPRLMATKRQATAAKIIGDYNVVRLAAADYRATATTYPATSAFGSVPTAMKASLPVNFKFVYGTADYRWRHIAATKSAAAIVGLEVRTTDANLLATVRKAFGGTTLGTTTQLTLVIE